MRFVFILILLLTLKACNKEKDCVEYESNSGLIERTIEMGKCYSYLSGSPYFIKDTIAYQELPDDAIDSIQQLIGCSGNPARPEIDFDKHALLGVRTFAKGCIVSYDRFVKKDSINQQLLYKVDVHSCGNCNEQRYNMNWVLIPCTPDYNVLVSEVTYH